MKKIILAIAVLAGIVGLCQPSHAVATAYIQSRTTLQTGTTAYPEVLRSSSAYVFGQYALNASSSNSCGYMIGTTVGSATGSLTTSSTTASSTYARSGLSATYTPKCASDKINIYAMCEIANTAGSSSFATVKRGSTDLDATGNGFAGTGSGTLGLNTSFTITVQDSPATTSSTVWEVYFRENAAANATLNPNAQGCVIRVDDLAQ